jgi:hypothetical protein
MTIDIILLQYSTIVSMKFGIHTKLLNEVTLARVTLAISSSVPKYIYIYIKNLICVHFV